ncbi:PBS lyase [Streptomyces sp. NPDC051940]|uniref:PBS lyase n=1 Tax=Streptomyces sp. NPDC051940 TaxID=3155675 RepID=UPI003445EB25
MLSGVEEVDWASMEHAYGSAAEVPGMLRGLASADPAERDVALDGMYGAVHHQGDVYDSTLACIPFLFELVTQESVPERGRLVELLVSIGGGDGALEPGDEDEDEDFDGEDEDGDDDLDGEFDEDDDWEANFAMAAAALRAGSGAFVELAADRDAGVRTAAPGALVVFHEDPGAVLDLLRERLAVEPERAVRLALVRALGLLPRRSEALTPQVTELLAGLAGPGHEAAVRLAALGCLAVSAPGRLPADVVGQVGELLRQRRAEPDARAADDDADRPRTDTLVSRLRDLRPDDDEGDRLLRALHAGLDDRVAERIALMDLQLRSPSTAERTGAVWMSSGLFRGRRGDYAGIVALTGEHLRDPDPRLRAAAASVLQDLFALAAPAADALAETVAAAEESRVRHWEQGPPSLGEPLVALIRCGDARAVPVLAELLREPVLPRDIGNELSYLGSAARPLGPLLREALGRVRPGDDGADRLVYGLAAAGESTAVPELAALLRQADPREDRWFVQAAIRALGGFGTDAAEAEPELRGLLAGEFAVPAAEALWAVTGDTRSVLPLLLRAAEADSPHERRRAAAVLGTLGPTAAPAVNALRSMLTGTEVWERTDGAVALWRIARDAEAVLPVLLPAWRENVYTRVTVAGCLGEIGPAAGAQAAAVLRDELAAVRRHNVQDGGFGSHDIDQDLRLLDACRTALDRIEAD